MAPPGFVERYGPWALVTGAAEGLGAAFARALAARGLSVVLLDRQADAVSALAAELEERHGARTRPLVLDLTSDALVPTVRALAAELPIGLLVCNAGLSHMGRLHDLDLEAQLGVVDLNCRATLALTHVLGAPMRARGRGGILLLSSSSALLHTPLLANYVATKAYNLALAEALWEELRHEGVDVLGLAPGIVRTGAIARRAPDPRGSRGLVSEPDAVVEKALAALGHRPSLVPGLTDRLGALVLGSLVPRRFALPLARRALLRVFPGAESQDVP